MGDDPNKSEITVSQIVGISGLVIAMGAGWANLTGEIATLKAQLSSTQEWRQTVDRSRFTVSDGLALELRLEQAVGLERAYARAICAELLRITREIDKIPTNDCGRP